MEKRYRAIGFVLMSAVGFASMSAFVQLMGDLGSMQKSLFRNLGALIIALIWMKKKHTVFSVPRAAAGPLLARCILGTVGIFCNFYGVSHLLLSDANMLNKFAPFSALFFSFLLLGEAVAPIQVLFMSGAFAGCLFVMKPGFEFTTVIPAAVALLGGIAAGAAYTQVRVTSKKGVDGPAIVFWFSLFSTLAVIPFVLVHHEPMTGMQLLYGVGVGISAAVGQAGITLAYASAPSREISIFEYTQIPFSALLGFLFFGQIPDGYSFLGYLIVIGMAVLMFLYNNQMLFFRKKEIET